MENNSTYHGYDLRSATQYDIATQQRPPIPIDFEQEVSEEEERILSLYLYAEEYDLTDLMKQLKDLFKEKLIALLE